MNHSSPETEKTDPASLARLFDGTSRDAPWQDEELKQVFRHQLTAPVQFDMAGFNPDWGERLRLLAAAEGLLLQSFGDLFAHPHPPVEMLEMVKDYAKRSAASPRRHIPKDVARALYYLAIVSARLRCRQRISSLEDEQLIRGVQWLLDQPWLDDASKSLLSEGLAMLGGRQEVNP